MKKEPLSPLVLAAQELEDELRRCEKAVEEAARLRLNSEKHIARAAQALTTAAEGRDRMGGKVDALMGAIQAARGRMEELVGRMGARAGEIQERVARLETHRTATTEIGASFRELNEFAKETRDLPRILERLAPVEARVSRAFEEARADGFEDVARDIAALRDMLATMRKKLQSI
ncbi:MAG TPA: hypothetical protein VEJ18_04540 [Planctomycetota bacterium]|nr:hypothetical protein [Planctomycetota bacterium]